VIQSKREVVEDDTRGEIKFSNDRKKQYFSNKNRESLKNLAAKKKKLKRKSTAKKK